MELRLLTALAIGLAATGGLQAPAMALGQSLAAFSQTHTAAVQAVTALPLPALPTQLYPQIVANPLSYQTVVNKKFQLASSFVPPDLSPVQVAKIADDPLRAEAARALERLFAAAAGSGLPLQLNSGYRSFDQQKVLYSDYVLAEGLYSAEASSAHPGYSEHQTGLAADFGAQNPVQTRAAQAWVAARGPEFGFVVRYPAGKEQVTGYQAEPWHIRYVGIEMARALATTRQVLEEYFHLPGGDYKG